MPHKPAKKTGITPALIKRIRKERDNASRIPGTRTEEELLEMRKKRKEILREAERLLKENHELTEKEAIIQAVKNMRIKKLHGGNF